MALLGALLVSGLGLAAPGADAAPTPLVTLGSASTYAVLSGASIGNTVSAPGDPHTILRGDLGVVANTQPTGFPPGVVTGAVEVGSPAATQAGTDALAAYNGIAARTGGATLAGALAGATIAPGLYSIAGAASNTTTVTLDAQGDANAVFVFQVNGAMTTAALSHVVLINGAQASRVFWQVNGAASIGAGASFAGTLIALNAVGVGNGGVVNGRVFALNGALTLDDNAIYAAPPVVAITGGPSAYTTDTTPTIAGTTDVQAPTIVSVTINGQTLTTTPSGGAWSVTSAILANGVYPVVASATDGAGTTTTTTQQLTVDTVPPVVTLDSGLSLPTADATPTISGTSDVAPGTLVRVEVDTHTLNALVQVDGSWNITPPALSSGSHSVSASVVDPAGNVSTATAMLTIDNDPPLLTVSGGATALVSDATPTIVGSSDAPPGTIVTVTLADQTLTSSVQSDGTWSATSAFLADGPHRVIISVFDAAGNETRFTQTLTIDTVAPTVVISGGAARTTSELDPTISGRSNAPPGTTLSVSIAGQTMTTLVQPDGSWNATPPPHAYGTWIILASASDAAGNVGSATQTLIIAPVVAGPTGAMEPPVAPLASVLPLASEPVRPDGFDAVAATTVTPDTRQKIKGSTLSISTKVTAPAGGRIVATARGTVKIAGIARAITLTTVTTALLAGQSATQKLIPKGNKNAAKSAFSRLKAGIRKGRKVIATITITIADAAGHTRVITRTVVLT